MKSWKLIGVREYKLETFDTSQSECADTSAEIAADSIGSVKVKINKANLSPIDISLYKTGSSKSITPSRSAVALVSECSCGKYQVGQRVFLSPYHTDNTGAKLLASLDSDGYLSDFTIADLSNVFAIPEGVSDNEVLFTEDIAMCIAGLSKFSIDKGQYILLCGASYLNCIFAQIAIYYQAIPIIIDKDEDRLNIARNLGVYYTIDTTSENAERKTLEITSGKMFDTLIIDADNYGNVDDYLHLIKNDGVIGIYGYSRQDINLTLRADTILEKGLTVASVNNGEHDIRSAINLLANRAIRIDYLIEDETPFNNFLQIMKNIADRANPYKHVITFN